MNEEVYDIGSGYSAWEKQSGDVLRVELGYREDTQEPCVMLTVLRVGGEITVGMNLSMDEADFLYRALKRTGK